MLIQNQLAFFREIVIYHLETNKLYFCVVVSNSELKKELILFDQLFLN